MPDHERRNTLRAPFEESVTVESVSSEQQVVAVNISENGMLFRKSADSPVQQGEEIFLTFALLNRLKPIKVLSWVVDERPKGDFVETHVTFMFLSNKDEALIRDFVFANSGKGLNTTH